MEIDAIRALYDAVIAGWNAHSGQQMAAPFAEDGVVIGFDGSVHSGRDTIAKEIDAIFADRDVAPFVVKVRDVRALGDDAVVLRAISGLIPPGQSKVRSETNAHQTLVAERTGGRWQVALFQNTPAQFHGRPQLVEEMTAELQQVADAG